MSPIARNQMLAMMSEEAVQNRDRLGKKLVNGTTQLLVGPTSPTLGIRMAGFGPQQIGQNGPQ
jgi:hypothetical protein